MKWRYTAFNAAGHPSPSPNPNPNPSPSLGPGPEPDHNPNPSPNPSPNLNPSPSPNQVSQASPSILSLARCTTWRWSLPTERSAVPPTTGGMAARASRHATTLMVAAQKDSPTYGKFMAYVSAAIFKILPGE